MFKSIKAVFITFSQVSFHFLWQIDCPLFNRIKILFIRSYLFLLGDDTCILCFLRTIFLKPICLSMNLQEVFFFFRESDYLIDNIF